jgi:phosphoglycerol transferase MdoB-like AlkP superfamily enzyme
MLLLVQAENMGWSGLRWLVCMQGQNVFAVLAVWGLAALAAKSVWSRWAFFAAYVVLTLVVACDSAYFRLFGDHYRLSLAEGMKTIDPTLGFSSIAKAAGPVLWINLALAVVVLAWLGWWTGKKHRTSNGPAARRQVHWMLGVGCWMLGVSVFTLLAFLHLPSGFANAARHPLFPLVQEALLPRVTTGLSAKAGDDSPIDAKPSHEPALTAVAQKIHAASPQPNIVFIVLESVGAEPLLPLDPEATPNLAALSKSAVLFDTLYAVFPGTARNHVAINTGGYQLTWNSVYDTLHLDFTGPLMPRDFGAAGYQTALFSGERLDGEAMDLFERKAGWGTLYDFARDVKNHTGAKVLNSWGAKEETLLEAITPWLDAAKPPFLLSYMNTATHHPYSVPRDYRAPFPANTDPNRFRNALHYTDAAIGKLIEMLKARGLYDNTIIAITGDHGEAFGDRHPGNFTHKNAIYEENVRTFLLLAHPAIGETVRATRNGSSGDLYPTLAALAGLAPKVPGHDLLASEGPARLFTFTKCAFPEQWGLRDGRWKFIETIRERKAELFDLSADPTEQRNLADAHADLVARFSAQCERWYLRADAEFTARLSGYHAPALTVSDVRSYGPKIITASAAAPAADTLWIGDDHERTFTVVWRSPDGTRHTAEQKLEASQYKTLTPCPVPPPLAHGEWSVSIEDEGRALLRTSFTVQ